MTCVIALIDKPSKSVYFCTDSIGISPSYTKQIRDRPKVIEHDSGIYIAYAGSFRQADLIQYQLELPSIKTETESFNFHSYLVKEFIPALQKVLADHKSENESGSVTDSMLIAWKPDMMLKDTINEKSSQLFYIDCDWNVSPIALATLGSCADIAIGAVEALDKMKDVPKKLIRAMKICEKHSAGLAPPYHIVKV
jgi:hypothetical protein